MSKFSSGAVELVRPGMVAAPLVVKASLEAMFMLMADREQAAGGLAALPELVGILVMMQYFMDSGETRLFSTKVRDMVVAGSPLVAVSYTHLDVYKRQVV